MTVELAIALNRFGLGARGDEAAPAEPRRWLASQLAAFQPHPAALADVPTSAAMVGEVRGELNQIRTLARGTGAGRRLSVGTPPGGGIPVMADSASETSAAPDAAAKALLRKALRHQVRSGYGAQARARVAAALVTPTPFAERLVHFWANHFAVSVDKLATLGLAGTLEFEAIRPHIGGRFVDLLLAVERHPAMLLYLDQAQSIGPQSRLAAMAQRFNARRQPGLNENLAREILELHTLGVGSGYGQADVLELARALTGWSVGGFVNRPLGESAPMGAFVFQANWHEPGSRTLLGRRYDQPGEAQARAMFADLAVHPATARHLATKLARHFVADTPPPALVDRLAAAHVESGGDLAAVYRALVAAPEAWAAAAPMPKFKTPWDWTISALRAVGTREVPDLKVVGALAELGQPIWKSGSPAGWDDVAASWAAPDALLRRVEIASRIAATVGGRIDPRALAPRLLPGVLTAATAQAIARSDNGVQGLALLLASPEFLRR